MTNQIEKMTKSNENYKERDNTMQEMFLQKFGMDIFAKCGGNNKGGRGKRGGNNTGNLNTNTKRTDI